jgi:DNA-binding response OmpR family regulator
VIPERIAGDPDGGTGRRARVLLVDDEQDIRTALSAALGSEGLAIDLAEGGADGLRRALTDDYDLVILDVLVSGMDGRSVLRQLLCDRPWQAVMVLSCLDDVQSKVDCFELGARDYVTKPFSLAELLARVRNQLRGDYCGRMIRVGGLRLHIGKMEADIGDGPAPLTRLEFLVLRELMEHAGQSVSKGQLLASVWGYDFEPGSKFGDQLIRTVRGEGYQLVAG